MLLFPALSLPLPSNFRILLRALSLRGRGHTPPNPRVLHGLQGLGTACLWPSGKHQKERIIPLPHSVHIEENTSNRKKKFLHCEISYNYDNCKKKIIRAKFGAAGRILWCLDSNLTPTEFWESNEQSLSHTPSLLVGARHRSRSFFPATRISKPCADISSLHTADGHLPDTFEPQPKRVFLYSLKHRH